jgi:hypothetical protein
MGTEAVTYGMLCGYECMVGFLKPAPAGPGWCVWYEVSPEGDTDSETRFHER